MNVLLAEADVADEQLVEMEDVNPKIPSVDVVIILGANDVANPSELSDESSPLYGMPIMRAHEATTVYALKRGKSRGFSGCQPLAPSRKHDSTVPMSSEHELRIISQYQANSSLEPS